VHSVKDGQRIRRDSFFRDKAVWITGASSGIGEALAYRVAGAGAKVILSSNDEAGLRRVASNCGAAEGDVMLLPLDLEDYAALEGKAREALARFGRVDVLFNNAGISHRSQVAETDVAVIRKVMEIDFMGQAALTRAVLPSMIEKKSGHIVVTSSLAGMLGIPTRAAYCAAKHALQGFFDSLRAEVWRDNIRVTLICPTGVRTHIGDNALTGAGTRHGRTEKHIAKGMAPEECARRIMNAVAGGKEEVLLGPLSQKYPVYIRRFFPGVYSWLLKRVKPLS